MAGEGGLAETGSWKTGSVKATVHMFGEKMNLQGNSAAMRNLIQADLYVRQPSVTRELHLARKSISEIDENMKAAEAAKARAEHDLVRAKRTVKELTSRIEDSNLITKGKQGELKKLSTIRQGTKDTVFVAREVESSNRYDKTMGELESVKRELIKLKIDMEKALEEKSRAEKEAEISSSKMGSLTFSVEALGKEIEEVNEEQVLVELAQIEALKELSAIEAQRREEADRFSLSKEEMKMKINTMVEEIAQLEELKTKLATTNSDISMLQKEMDLMKKISRGVEADDMLENTEAIQYLSILKSATEELDREKRHLSSIEQDGFQLMSYMDVTRKELQNVLEEINQMMRSEEKTDKTVQNLNSKLLRARNKLETAIRSEEKEKALLSSLSVALDQLITGKTKAKNEKQLTEEETESTKLETQRNESQTDFMEERLQAALQELEQAKSSEAMALTKLKAHSESAMRARAYSSQQKSTITISKFEYEYLSGCATAAKETAEKKVEAAQEWIVALGASEMEAKVQIEAAQRQINEIRLKEELEIHQTQNSMSAKELVEEHIQTHKERRKTASISMQTTTGRKLRSSRDSDKMTLSRRANLRRSISPASNYNSPRSASFTIKRRTRVMPIIAKYFAIKHAERDPVSEV